MRIYLATWLEDNQGTTLTDVGSDKRLLSYYFVKEAPPDFIDRYAEKGTYPLKGGKNNVKD